MVMRHAWKKAVAAAVCMGLAGLAAAQDKSKEPRAEASPPSEWTSRASSAPVVAPPFQRTLAAGDMVRVRVVGGKRLVVEASAASKVPATVEVAALKDGKVVQQPPVRDIRLGGKTAPGPLLLRETPQQVSEFLLRADGGPAKLTVNAVDVPAGKSASAGGEFSLSVPGGRFFLIHLESATGSGAKCVLQFMTKGQPLPEKVQGKPAQRTIVLKAGGPPMDRTWTGSMAAEDVVVKVLEGQVKGWTEGR